MAQNISLLGATYQAVPSVTLPKSGGGSASFVDVTDTTAVAADVASGKYFYTAAGVRTAGTASGGGGGSSNLVIGEFNTGSTTLTSITVDIPYTGSGYPIAAMVYVKGGPYNSTSTGDSTWYNAVARYVIGYWSMVKMIPDQTPPYGTSTANSNKATTASIYKNSTSNATSYSRTSAMNSTTFTSNSASANGTTCVVFNSSKKISVRVGSAGNYGLFANTDYQYIIVYSS